MQALEHELDRRRHRSRRLADLEVGETPAGVASATEFVLEGLHLSKRLNKESVGARATFRGRS